MKIQSSHPLDAIDVLTQATGGVWCYDSADMVYQHESGFCVSRDAVKHVPLPVIVDAFEEYIKMHPQFKPTIVQMTDLAGPFKVNPLTGEPETLKLSVKEHWKPGPELVVLPRQLTKKMAGELYAMCSSMMYNGPMLNEGDLQHVWENLIEQSPGSGLVPLEVLKQHATVELSNKLQEYLQVNAELKQKAEQLGAQSASSAGLLEDLTAAYKQVTTDYQQLSAAASESMGELTDQLEQTTHFAKASINLLDGLLARVQEHGSMPKLVSDYGPLVDALRSELGGVLKAQQNIE